MDSLIGTHQDTFEWPGTLEIPYILPDPLSASPTYSIYDDVHTSQSSSMISWGNDASTSLDPKELDRLDSYIQPQAQTGREAGECAGMPPNSVVDFKSRRKRRLVVTSDTDNRGQPQQAELRRQRNRLAASKCRRKSKEKNEIMLERERELEQQHHMLKSCVESLRAEVLDLREEVLKHAGCDCEPIQNHISKSIQTVMGTAPRKGP